MNRILALLVLLPVVTAAEQNPLSVTASTNGSWSLSFETSPLPKGWFTIANKFERAKTTLVAEVTAVEEACSIGAQSDARVSTSDGTVTLTAIKNANGKNDVAYFWQYGGWDLNALRNSYSYEIRCGVIVETRGCTAARAIELTITAFEKNGVRTYTDDAGVSQPVTASVGALSLPAYYDEAANYTYCPVTVDCDEVFGQCNGPCKSSCPPANTQTGRDCREACGPSCEEQVHGQYPVCFAD
jgi:hypothetical protein